MTLSGSSLQTFLLRLAFVGLLAAGFSTASGQESGLPRDEKIHFNLDAAWGADRPDREGLRRDTLYFLGYQVAVVGILYVMPESVSGWTNEQKSDYSLSDWWDNVTHPGCDSDDFYINYIVHPYWGATYYVRASERGYDWRGAFWYSVLLSSMFEFGVEALFEEPSIQDLIVTPTLGSMVGHYFVGVRRKVQMQSASRGHLTSGEKWTMVLTDPLGTLNRQVDKLFGHETSLQVSPYFYVRQPGNTRQADDRAWRRDRVIGLGFHFTW